MPAYLLREHNKTSQTRKIRKIRTKKTKKPIGVLKNVMQEQITAARAKHEDEEEDTGIRPKTVSYTHLTLPTKA